MLPSSGTTTWVEYWPALLESGEVIDLGEVGIDAREGWLYPKHVEELCPGLPDWDAFLGCADIFATAETAPNGRYLDYPAEWQSRGGDLVREEGLPFEVIPAGSEGALVAELKSSVARQSPLVHDVLGPALVALRTRLWLGRDSR